MRWLLPVLLVPSLGIWLATRPAVAGSSSLWWMVGACYAVAAAIGAWRLHRRRLLANLVTPRWGDASIGAVTGLVLLLLSWLGRSQLMAVGTTQQLWLTTLYLQLGDPRVVQNSMLLTIIVVAVPLLEELVWRGFVQSELEGRIGRRLAWVVSAVLYAVATLPSAFNLAEPGGSPNPLLVLAALGCGLVWGFLVRVTGRLAPSAIAHAAFTYFTVAQFRAPGL